MRALLGFAIVVMLAACATRAIVPRDPLPVPRGLGIAQIEPAIERAVARTRHSHRWEQSVWAIEDHRPGRYVVAVHYRARYAQYEVAYTPAQVVTRLLGSKGFKQSATRVHNNVLDFQDLLESNIAAELRAVPPG